MEDTLGRVYTFKDDFFVGRPGKQAKSKANALRKEVVKKQKVDKVTNAESWTKLKKQCEMNAWWDYIRHIIQVSKELDAHFNFLRMHLMSHWVKEIHRYGALPQYSAERPAQAHKMNLKNSWNASNHNLKYMPQVITFQHRILSFDICELHLPALAPCRKNSAATSPVHPSGADLAAPLSFQS